MDEEKLEAGQAVYCTCGAQVGVLVQVNDGLWLGVNGVELSYGHGRCQACKRIWHFDSADIRLQRLIRRATIITIE